MTISPWNGSAHASAAAQSGVQRQREDLRSVGCRGLAGDPLRIGAARGSGTRPCAHGQPAAARHCAVSDRGAQAAGFASQRAGGAARASGGANAPVRPSRRTDGPAQSPPAARALPPGGGLGSKAAPASGAAVPRPGRIQTHHRQVWAHATGDAILQQVAARLLACIRTSDTACRYGGDEFVVLLPQYEGQESAAAVAEKIRARLAAPDAVDGTVIRVTVSSSMAVYPVDGQEYGDLMQVTDCAM
jgi:Diguanylate cyclase, GGDEF domain